MKTTEETNHSISVKDESDSNMLPTANNCTANSPKHAAQQSTNTLNYYLLWETTKKHTLAIATAIISLIESLSLIINMFPLSDAEKSLGFISEKMVFPLFLYIFAVIIALISLTICIVLAVKEYRTCSRTVFNEFDKGKIDNYLSNFIKSGESAVVLSHDMTWINDRNRTMLQQKAQRHELLLFLPHETPEVKELEKMGAEVRYFGNIIGDPVTSPVRSRMTLINWNKVYTKLTYPTKKNGLHINCEFNAGEPANQLAQDLINLLTFVSEKGAGQESIDLIINEYKKYPSDELFYKLGYQDRAAIQNWYNKYSNSGIFSIHGAFSLMCELVRYEDIDLKPDVEYARIKDYFCKKHNTSPDSFLNMYVDFRKMINM